MSLFDQINPFINLGAVGIIAFILIRQQVKMSNTFIAEMKKIGDRVEKIAENINRKQLEIDDAIIIFDAIMTEHISKKLDYLTIILEENHIVTREDQIKAKIKSQFTQITQMEVRKLDKFVTLSGFNLSIPLRKVNFGKFLGEIFEITFSKESNCKKIGDAKALMTAYVNDLREQII